MLSDPSRLPHRADITVGDMKFALNVSAVFDARRNYIGNVLEWHDVSVARVNEGMISALHRSQAINEFSLDGRILNANKNSSARLATRWRKSAASITACSSTRPIARPTNTAPSGKSSAAASSMPANTSASPRAAANLDRGLLQSILDQAGKPYKVVKFATDITAAQIETNEIKAKIAAISKAQAVIEFNLDGTIVTANENFLAVLGYSASEIVGRHHSMFVDPDYAKSGDYRTFWDRLNRGEYISDKFRRLGRGGKEIWIQASYNPLMDLNGKPYKGGEVRHRRDPDRT